MTFNTNQLLNDLIKITEQNQADLAFLAQCNAEELNKRSSQDSWSALECLEHLNIYSDYYIPEMKKTIQKSKYKEPSGQFKSGLLGNYFVKMVGPLDQSKKMKTLSASNPIGSSINSSSLKRFQDYQVKTLDLLKNAKDVDLAKNKIGISIAPWLKIKLGDALRVVIMHNKRHVIQALKAVK